MFQFVARLKRYFQRWVDLTEVTQDYDGLSDLLVREQFSEGMRLFLRERVPSTVEEMTMLAEQFMEAHGGSITMSKRPQHIEKPPRPAIPPAKYR